MRDEETFNSIPLLPQQMTKNDGHFYYAAQEKEIDVRRDNLTKNLYSKGAR